MKYECSITYHSKVTATVEVFLFADKQPYRQGKNYKMPQIYQCGGIIKQHFFKVVCSLLSDMKMTDHHPITLMLDRYITPITSSNINGL